MTQLNGFFELRTPADLVAKLEHDFNRLQETDPATRDAQYVAFDFFVTADHVAEWVAIANGGPLSQRRNYEHGPLVFHIASGPSIFALMMIGTRRQRTLAFHGPMGLAINGAHFRARPSSSTRKTEQRSR